MRSSRLFSVRINEGNVFAASHFKIDSVRVGVPMDADGGRNWFAAGRQVPVGRWRD